MTFIDSLSSLIKNAGQKQHKSRQHARFRPKFDTLEQRMMLDAGSTELIKIVETEDTPDSATYAKALDVGDYEITGALASARRDVVGGTL